MDFGWNPSSHSQEAMAALHNSPFTDSQLRIEVCEAHGFSEQDGDFVRRIVAALPGLMPDIVANLKRYAEDLGDDAVFRRELRSPGLLFDLESLRNSKEWHFCVDRPSYGSNFGYHVVFAGSDFKDVWAGD